MNMEELTYQKPDLHMHSVYSDGTDTPEVLLHNVCAAGIDLFALTDHDTAEGCAAMQSILKPGDPKFIGGIEFSCRDDIGKYHILGYCYDINKQPIHELVAFAHNMRLQKATLRFKYLEEAYGFVFTEQEKRQLCALKNPGKPHFADLMLRKGYIQKREDGFKLFAGFREKTEMINPEDAIDAIMQSDGIPVLAHGILGDGSSNLTVEEIRERVDRFKDAGLMGLECYYSTYTEEQKSIMLSLAKEFNLMVTAGSDYHGSRKSISLGDTNNPDPKELERFYIAIRYLL